MAALKNKVRKFGTYIPNVNSYIGCNGSPSSTEVKLLTTKYHVPLSAVDTFFHYNLDISTFAQSAQEAMVQFKAAGVTTVVLACDPFSVGFLTKAAAAQNYYPEWMLEGTAATDTDNEAQTYDPAEVNGHLFGVSEANATVDIFGPTSPAGKLYQKLTGHPIPAETDGDYAHPRRDLRRPAGGRTGPHARQHGPGHARAAGPRRPRVLVRGVELRTRGRPATRRRGAHLLDRRPLRLVEPHGDSPVNGKAGTFVAIDNGKRWRLGQWPKTLPKLFTTS